jgi:hypothetical protein
MIRRFVRWLARREITQMTREINMLRAVAEFERQMKDDWKADAQSWKQAYAKELRSRKSA